MKPKIGIILDHSFTEKDYKRFGIKPLQKKFNVFVLDFTKNFSKKLVNSNVKYAKKTYRFKGYYAVKSFDFFEKFLTKNKLSNCINYINQPILEAKLANILKKNKVPNVKIQSGLSMGPGDPRSLIQIIHIIILKFTNKKRFVKFIANQINKLKKKFIKKDPQIIFDKVVVSGKVGLKDAAIGLKTKVIYAHGYDYDYYLNNNKVLKLKIKKPYAVFLDQYVPLHPDSQNFKKGVYPRCTPEKYYPALNSFFNIFEKNFKMEVIVCAHPKSDYGSGENYLYGRKFIKNKTMHLVENSNIVFAHCSTAISFAILYKKPLVFLLSDEYVRSFDNYTPSVMAKKLNSPCFNIDDKNNNSKIKNINLFKINTKKYKIYKDDYIRYPSKSDKKLWEIFNEKI